MTLDPEAVIHAFRRRETRALSRAISIVEQEVPGYRRLFDRLWSATEHAVRIGVTGAPGAGKSTLVSGLIKAARGRQQSVGVVAVDPSSPLSGGALLGDRIRMSDHGLDEGVFIRSMATRGALGGLAGRSVEATDLCDAFGFDRIFIETVGVGQIEFDIMQAADLVLVVVHAGAGDMVQAMKAGLLEAADVLVVNKADLPGAERLASDLREAIELRAEPARRRVTIATTVATTGAGVPELSDQVAARFDELQRDGTLAGRRRERRSAQVRRIIEAGLRQRLMNGERLDSRLAELLEDHSDMPPYRRAALVLDHIVPQLGEE